MISEWIKTGVCGDLHPIMQKAHGKIVSHYESLGIKNFFITSRRDGNHIPGSFHYIGLAEDFGKHRLITRFELQHLLGNDFDIIEYDDHFHVEYDPEKKYV